MHSLSALSAPLARLLGLTRAAALGLSLATALASCSSPPPPHFQEGGAPLALGRARWDVGGDHVIDVMPDGRVLSDGDPKWVFDGQGRVFDKGKDPLALLRADGLLSGSEGAPLGVVGSQTSSAPESTTAWLLLQSDGLLVAFDQEGAPLDGGRWQGCTPEMARTCLLVSHLTRLEARARSAQAGVGFGIGFGVIR